MKDHAHEQEHRGATANSLWGSSSVQKDRGSQHPVFLEPAALASGAPVNPKASAALAAPLVAHWGVSDPVPAAPACEADGMPRFIPVSTEPVDGAEAQGRPGAAHESKGVSDNETQQDHAVGKTALPARDPGKEDEGGNSQQPPTPKAEMTGLGHSVSLGRFVTAAQEVESQWTKLKPQERANKLGQAANEELKQAGVPKTTTKLAELPAQRGGEFNFPVWTLDMSKATFSAASVTTADAGTIASHVYHESRHAEQWHRMARFMAGQGKKASEIASTMHIPARIAADAAKNPLTASGAEGKEAASWYESVYGKHAAKRNKIISNLTPLAKKVMDAATASNLRGAEYERTAKDPKADSKAQQAALARWKAAYAKWQAAAAEQQANYQAYRNLPEEADAWKIGDSVTATYPKATKPKGP